MLIPEGRVGFLHGFLCVEEPIVVRRGIVEYTVHEPVFPRCTCKHEQESENKHKPKLLKDIQCSLVLFDFGFSLTENTQNYFNFSFFLCLFGVSAVHSPSQ